MKPISIFDIIGPVMVGPSSSHTAGALRIALYARKMCGGRITKAEFTLYGSFAGTYEGHGTDKALIAGILGFEPDDLRIRDSFLYAERAAVEYSFILDRKTEDVHPNTVDIKLTDDRGELTRITGVSVGGGNAEIRNINGIDIVFTGEYPTIIISHFDTAGVIAYITKVISDNNINIAFLRLYREEKGQRAYSIVEADDIVDASVIGKVKEHPSINNAILIQ